MGNKHQGLRYVGYKLKIKSIVTQAISIVKNLISFEYR